MEIGSCLNYEDFNLDSNDELNLILEEIKAKNLAEIQIRLSDEANGVCFFGITSDGFDYLDNLDSEF
jgi:hypothetical protein